MYPVLLRMGPLTVYSYGLMVALAFLAGIGMTIFLAQKEKISTEKILDLAAVVLVAAIVGGRIFYVIEFFGEFKTRPLEALFIWQGGLVFVGGLFLAIAAVLFFARRNNIPVFKLLDIITPATALGYAIGRIGCFLNGCCYGVTCSLPWAVNGRHPTQIYASLAGLVMFGLLFWLLKKKQFDGQVFSVGLILYCIYRFLIEFIRVNTKFFYLSSMQWLCLLIIVLAAALYIKLFRAKAS